MTSAWFGSLIVGAEAVVAQRREQLEVLGDLDLVGHVGGVVGRLGVDRQVVDDGAADRRAVGIGIERKLVRQARLVESQRSRRSWCARLARDLEPRRHLVLRDAGDELADEVGLIDEIGVVGLALAPLAADGHQVHRIVERKRRFRPRSRATGSREVVVGEADVARRGHPREALVVDVARGIGELEVLVEFVLDLFRDDVGVGRRDVAERPARDAEEVVAGDRQRGAGVPLP